MSDKSYPASQYAMRRQEAWEMARHAAALLETWPAHENEMYNFEHAEALLRAAAELLK